MLSKKLHEAMNAQINAELWSAYLYLSMSMDAEAKGLKGLEMFQDTLAHEKEVTAMINNLAAIAAEDKDYASSNMLVWFVDEQVEEEESAREMITACEAVEGNKFGLYMLDKELAARTYTQASPLATANA